MERQEALHGYGANGSDRQPEHNGNVSEPSPECAGMYYFDPHLNQPVSTASWSGSTQPCDVRDGARWQGSESYPKGEPKRPGSQDRSRRKGEPSRYDRRVWSRSRTGAADQHHRYEERLWRDSRNQAGANHYEQSPRYDSCEPNITPSKTSVGHSKHQLPYKQWRSKVHGSVGAEQYGETWSDVPCDAATDHSWQHSQHDPRGGQDASNTVSLGKPEYTPPSRQKRNGIGPPKVPQASSRGATSRPKGRSTNRRTNQDRKQKPGDNSSRLDGNLLEPGGPCLLETLFGIKQEHCSPPSESPSNSCRPVACQNEPSSSCASTESHSGKPAGTPETGVKQRNWPDRKKRHQAVGDERSHHTDLQREVSCREYRNRRGNESSRCRKEDRLGGFHDVWDGRKKHGPDVWQEGASAGAHAWEAECRKQRSTHGKAAAQSVIAEGSSKRQSPTKKGYPQVNRADDAPQKDRLTEQLLLGEYECMVCCERVRGSEPIWSCGSCFHIFHLQCARKWALSPAALVKEGGWRCPACQGTVLSVPSRYMCFCGKRSNPEWNRYGVPHSCGEMCGRLRGSPTAGSIPCVHRCNLQCHPGQCPPCSATVRRACPCGKLTRQVRCSQDHDTSCGRPCERLLNCELHECQELCHAGSCKPCSAIVHQECFCGKQHREAVCTRESHSVSAFSCGDPCGRPLTCGQHICAEVCHSGDCELCPLSPALVTHCPCGKTPLDDLGGVARRSSCTASVPLCGETCGKMLPCGPKDNWHRCTALCHEGPCPPCPKSTPIRCRCNATSKEVPCTEVVSLGEQLCQRRCQKRRQCGRHKCLSMCCVDAEHQCQLICGKRLSCGLHVCEEQCHRGNCHTCWNVSFEDLHCHCGSAILSAPIACGTRPPECGQPCARSHPCGHPVTHTCHSDAVCPPCATLTEKWCFGHHEKRKAVPCFLEGLSCGLSCQQELPCGQHRCLQTCHQGPCPYESQGGCGQQCTVPRQGCGHPCGHPCHPGQECPASNCKTKVSISCVCGHRSEKLPCGGGDGMNAQSGFHQLSASLLATKIQEIQLGESVDIGEMVALSRARPSRLECNEECAVLERNRRLAAALQIPNADVSSRVGPPTYSEFLREEARKNPTFVSSVHDKLTDLVNTARQSKQKFRSHCFPSMNRDQRRTVHELAEFFGCETQSYDQEPYRNVVVSAYKDRCRIPSGSVVSVVQREGAGVPQRKGPVPLAPSWKRGPVSLSSPSTLCGPSVLSSTSNARQEPPSETPPLDYFNFESS